MIGIRMTRGRPAEADLPPAGTPARRRSAGQPLWSSDGVLWGVVRAQDCFDMHDTARHSGLVQHAFPLGRDWLAACGFRTPLQRAFDGVRRPLLAMPGIHNPRCDACLALIVPAARPDLRPADHVRTSAGGEDWIQGRLDPRAPSRHDPRPWRPAVGIPVGPPVHAAPPPAPTPAPEAAASWPAADRAPDLDRERLRVIDAWRHAGKEPIPTPAEERVETAGPVGRRVFLEVDRAERIHR